MRKITQISGIILMLIFFASASIYAQKTIKVKDVTPDKLADICKANDIEVLEIKDTYVKVKDLVNIYLDIDPTKRFVSFSSSFPLVSGVRPEVAVELMNKLNTELILLKTTYNAQYNTITYKTYFWVEFGFVDKTMVKALNMHLTAIKTSLTLDTEKLIK